MEYNFIIRYYPKTRTIQLKPIDDNQVHFSIAWCRDKESISIPEFEKEVYKPILNYILKENWKLEFTPVKACRNCTYGHFNKEFEQLLLNIRDKYPTLVSEKDLDFNREEHNHLREEGILEPVFLHISHSRSKNKILNNFLQNADRTKKLVLKLSEKTENNPQDLIKKENSVKTIDNVKNILDKKSYCEHLKCYDYTVIGSSIAERYINIIIPQLKITFNAGIYSEESIHNSEIFLISQGSLDHIGGLDIILTKRAKIQNQKSYIIMPGIYINPFKEKLWNSYLLDNAIDSDKITYEERIKYLSNFEFTTSEQIEYNNYSLENQSKGMFLRSFRTSQSIPSYGYLVLKYKKVLKAQYSNLEPKDMKSIIVQAKKDGLEVYETIEFCEISLTGNTHINSLIENYLVMNAKLLICELSEVDSESDPEYIHESGHIHIRDIEDHQDKFKNGIIVFNNFDKHHYNKEMIKEHLDKAKIKQEFKSKLKLLLQGF